MVVKGLTKPLVQAIQRAAWEEFRFLSNELGVRPKHRARSDAEIADRLKATIAVIGAAAETRHHLGESTPERPEGHRADLVVFLPARDFRAWLTRTRRETADYLDGVLRGRDEGGFRKVSKEAFVIAALDRVIELTRPA